MDIKAFILFFKLFVEQCTKILIKIEAGNKMEESRGWGKYHGTQGNTRSGVLNN